MTDTTFKLFLVRHGEAAARWGEARDPGLSDLGREQASAVSEELLAQLDGQVNIVSSPLLRARQTAEPFAAALGASVEIDHRFREIQAPAALTHRWEWLKQFAQQTWESQSESLLEWRARATERLMEYSGCTVVFTHFMMLNAVVGQLTDCSDTLCFRPNNGSITQLQRDGNALQVISLGNESKTVVN